MDQRNTNFLWFYVLTFVVTAQFTAGQLVVPNATFVQHTNHPNDVHLLYANVPAIYQDFVNHTLARRALGICQKEVPTASLAEYHGMDVRGNGSNPSLSRITVCCQGYQRHPHIFRKCEPICANKCPNGVCVGPNECICYPEHVKNLAGFCVPVCPVGCDNGVCDGSQCNCNRGYIFDVQTKLCVPVCNPSCGRGNCTAPNQCSCVDGYELGANGECKPKCTGGCQYGECVAPEKCDCPQGFALVDTTCMPICSKGCTNGICTAPDHCSCHVGYRINRSGTCDPKCDKPCLNGHCLRPNECQCNTGYEQDSYDSFRCNPHCPEPCVNGVCSSPGRCLCNIGFVKDRSTKANNICIPKPL